MASIFGDSWDYYVTADLFLKWTTLAQVDQPTAVPTITAAAVANGVNGLRFPLVGAGFGVEGLNINKTVSAGDNTFISGFNFRYSAVQGSYDIGIASVKDGSSCQCQLILNRDGTLSVCRGDATGFTPRVILGTTSIALLQGSFYHIAWKIKVHNTTGTVDVRVNNISALSLSNQDTQNTGNQSWNVASIGLQQTNNLIFVNAANLDYDDFYLCDGSGGVNNDFLGVLAAGALHAQAGNGADTDFTPSTGSDHGNMVKELYEDGDTTYNVASSTGNKDTYAMDNVPTGTTIKFIQSIMVVRKTDAGGRTVANVLHIGSTDYIGADRSPIQTYTQLLTPYDVSPATSVAFTYTELNALEGGIKITG